MSRVGDARLHPSISAAKTKVLRFLGGGRQNLRWQHMRGQSRRSDGHTSSTRLMTRDFRVPRPPRRPDFARSDSVAYEFVHFGLGNREPETFRGARSLDARRDNPRAGPRRSARHPAAPPRWPTARDLRARNPLSQKRARTPQHANAPTVRPGRSLLTCRRASVARLLKPSGLDGLRTSGGF